MTNFILTGLLMITAALGLSIYKDKQNNPPPVEVAPVDVPEKKQDQNPVTLSTRVAPSTIVKNIKVDESRTIYIEGFIGPNAVNAARELDLLQQENNDPIYVLINSPGGSVLDGAVFVSAIESSKAPVYTVCIKMCASMASTIHAYGKKRLMTNRAVLMYHPASASVSGTIEQMKSLTDFYNRYVNKFELYIANRAKIDFHTYKNEVANEIWIDSEEATARGLNDEIVSLNLQNATPRIKFMINPENEKKLEINDKLKELVWEYKK